MKNTGIPWVRVTIRQIIWDIENSRTSLDRVMRDNKDLLPAGQKRLIEGLHMLLSLGSRLGAVIASQLENPHVAQVNQGKE